MQTNDPFADHTDPLPRGARYKGTYRTWVGYFLFLYPLGAIHEISEGKMGFLQAIAATILAITVGMFLVKWGRKLKEQKIIVYSKKYRPTHTTGMTTQPIVQLCDLIALYGDRERVSLFVVDDLHLGSIASLLNRDEAHGKRRKKGGGALAAWGEIVAEPGNLFDPHAIQVWVEGFAVGYFALEWKERAHAQLRLDAGRPSRVPVVLRLWDGKPFVWACADMAGAEDFAGWLRSRD